MNSVLSVVKHLSMPRDTTNYFTGLAGDYAANRPSYPAAAIDFILAGLNPAGTSLRAADIGCGTGISTRLLAARGVHVIGIDPNDDMIRQARETTPPEAGSIEYNIGTSENSGLDDAGVHLVLCAQSFHWFDPLAALREFQRILAPGGRLALMWNITDDRDAFTAGYREVVSRAQADAATRGLVVKPERAGDAALGGYFHNLRTQNFTHRQAHDLQGLLGRIRSASYFPRQDPLRAELETVLRELYEQHQRGGQIQLVYRTEVTLADRA